MTWWAVLVLWAVSVFFFWCLVAVNPPDDKPSQRRRPAP